MQTQNVSDANQGSTFGATPNSSKAPTLIRRATEEGSDTTYKSFSARMAVGRQRELEGVETEIFSEQKRNNATPRLLRKPNDTGGGGGSGVGGAGTK